MIRARLLTVTLALMSTFMLCWVGVTAAHASCNGANPPSITSISPLGGPVQGGTIVTITGTSLGCVTVSFGGLAGSNVIATGSSVQATSPAASAGPILLTVTNPNVGAYANAAASTSYTYYSVPSISAVTPNTGAAAGGTRVTITGSDFTGATSVNFGATAATSFTVDSATQITAVTPAGTAGSVDVNVTTLGGTATSSSAFTYVSDTTAPTVTISGPTNRVNAPFTLTMTFSEVVTGFDVSDITITNATLSQFTEVTTGTVYTVEVTPVMGQTVTASIAAGVVTDAAGNPNVASLPYSVQSGSVKSAFDSYKDDIKRIIQDQAEKRLITLMSDNGRMMQDIRTRFVGFAGEGQQAGLTANGFDAIAFDVNGTVNVDEDLNGVVAASSGEFLGQTGMVNGANWRLSGNFDVLLDGDQSLTAFDARVAREQFLTRNVLWGAFGGGQFSNSDISDSFIGSETTWQLYGGTYAVGKLTSNLFADAYASAGYGWTDLSMNNDVLALDSNYGTFTWQVGGSLAGLIEMERFSLLPTVSVSYGNSNLGEIDFTAQAYGLSDGVSLDADYVAMGVLRLTPEIRVPLGANATTEDGVVLGLLPSFICQQVVADDSETDCGWGVGAELIQAGSSGLGQFSGKVDFQQIGGISQIGGQINYAIRF